MNALEVKEDIKIEDMIFEVRGKEVILDSDLAKLYNVETKRINEAVKNNLEKFPEEFCFKIIEKYYDLRSKYSTSKIENCKSLEVFCHSLIDNTDMILKVTRTSID